ncbi:MULTISPECIES: cobalamin B12-binding domain-containing protein [Cytobacillus]|uniref:cobalamin B12-binding domain-containing protein n=1 Tax=Cytobacillus TaxID=2675230 RepID=UPI001CD305EE|nr:cobalamin-dependent protein [Cytobacillus kochii]MCA1024742.1 cobalamin-dependent protein [Cytobacillus kochii]MCM3323775.1 cobalamin-dependent protein [Cytobacillus kochii]MCM3346044.1 cobalamin-dependent protein [Cytobacillus kochii]
MTRGEELAEILLSGAVADAWEYIEQFDYLTNVEIYQDIITPAMVKIGLKWENFEITVADEHLASGVCDFILSRLAAKHKLKPVTAAPTAMFLCLSGEQHYLGLKMVASIFEENGWRTKFLGANLPVQYALQAAKDWKPDVIGLSVSIATHLPTLTEYMEAFSYLPKKPRVLLGGRLTNLYDLASFTAIKPEIISNLYAVDKWITAFNTKGRKNAIN